MPRVQIALAWLLQKEAMTAPIIGVTKMSQLEEAVDALSITLTPEEITALEELYVPHPVVGAL
ncbi:L-glyceraldehyde 3-phosphate reductase [compost metagenome]